ncbi:hypothetical protein AMJ83_11690 [candidate division WOR_3 bacterium SM23_42]|uniref:RHS repeat-associated core domain-containing protein n=1 Tax=candidate division WOR_3 bacterium SM23_42 TaxID=1703779 RepID=A0A0S8FMW7_UNCW3|nr:MAG: hypothetical protein AMJ83_11690 [candidate division WOR_3 bacterium SM23_42]
MCEFGGHLDLKAKYVYATGMLLARYDESPTDSHYYNHDGLGSVIGMTDKSKSVERSYFYDEFGTSLGSWGTVSNSYLYTGQEYDGSISQLYNLRARYYKSSIGRFISEDQLLMPRGSFCPITNATKSPQGLNAYLYVRDNPVNFIDPIGLRYCYIAIASGSGGIGFPVVGPNIEIGAYTICCTKNSDPRCGFECRTCGYICAGPALGIGVPIPPVMVSGGAQLEAGGWHGDIPGCGFGLQLTGMALAGKGIAGSIPWAVGRGIGFALGGGAGAGVSLMLCWSWEISKSMHGGDP